MLNSAMHAAGTTTAHGWIVRPMLFSLIINPQSACGGEIPKPRKLIAATSAIDHAQRRPNSTSTSVIRFGQDVVEQDLPSRGADHLGRLDVLAVRDLERGGAHGTRHRRASTRCRRAGR